MREQGVPSQGLRGCLVESEEADFSRPRASRRTALLVSLLLQVAIVGTMLLVPLLATGNLPRVVVLVPSPPYRGLPHGHQQPQPGRPPSADADRPPLDPGRPIFQPPRIPSTTANINDAADAFGDTGPLPVGPPGDPHGVLPPIGPEDQRRWFPNVTLPPPQPRPRPRVSEGVQQALLVHRVQPGYPILARRARLEGTVYLRAIIARDGTVHSLELISGHPILAQAAKEAVLQWRYRPTLLNGEPVEVETHITVVFTLR